MIYGYVRVSMDGQSVNVRRNGQWGKSRAGAVAPLAQFDKGDVLMITRLSANNS
jgi:hypothetical protein